MTTSTTRPLRQQINLFGVHRPGLAASLLFSPLLALLVSIAPSANAQGNATNGLYLSKAAGCVGCHTVNKAGATPYAGGRALETPFGTFYGPNITPDKETGIGTWSDADFKRAIRQGERRDGSHYFPAFPYPSFTGMSDRDIQDLWAYLKSLPPIKQANREHELRFPYNMRFLVAGWKLMFFTPGPVSPPAQVSAPVARGAYLVGVLGHCSECHTPRNFLGGPDKKEMFAGAKIPEGKVPNLTPTRLKKWSDADLAEYFKTGTAPNGDVVVEPMSEVVNNTTSQLTAADVAAMIAYLRTLPPRDEQK
jgi:mono/diheme cytochrome c family protein